MKYLKRLSSDVPYPVVIIATWSLCFILIFTAGRLLNGFLDKIMSVVVPLAIAALIAAMMAPVNLLLRRLKFPRTLAALCSLVVFIGIIALGMMFAINQFASGYLTIANKAQEGVSTIVDWLHTGPLKVPDNPGTSVSDRLSSWIQQHSGTLASNVVDAGTTTVDAIASVLICLFAAFFFLYDGYRIYHYLLGWLPRAMRPVTEVSMDAAWTSLRGYMRMLIVVAAINATGIGLGALILGIPMVIPVTVIVFLCSFVPIVGAVASGAVAVLLAFVDGGLTHALIMLAIVIGVHLIETNVLHPFLMGHAVNVHPLAVIVVVAIGTYLYSLPGALFAVPVTAMLNAAITAGVREYNRRNFATPHFNS